VSILKKSFPHCIIVEEIKVKIKSYMLANMPWG
jgi:hypothetical protein